MSFTLCLNTSTIKPQPLLEKIRIAEAAGFAGVELWINDIYEYVGRGGEVRDVEQALQDHGLIVPCMIALRGWGEAVGPDGFVVPVGTDEGGPGEGGAFKVCSSQVSVSKHCSF